MIDLKNLKRAIDQLAEEKGIDGSKVLEAIESAIAAAYKKDYEKKSELIRAKFDLKTGELKFWQVKTVVDETTVRVVTEEEAAAEAAQARTSADTSRAEADKPRTHAETVRTGADALPRPSASGPRESAVTRESAIAEEEVLPRYNPDRHIFLDEAKKIKKDVQLGEELLFPLETHEEFGRIAAQTAKQVVLQKIREAERESVLKEFQGREGEIVSGVVQRFDRGNIYVDLGRTTGILFGSEAIPGEHYRPAERLRFIIIAIQEETRVPGIILSRSHPKFVVKLFALEVPEIADNLVEIKAIAREPGSRTKVAVASNAPGVDPVGACVGQRGTRVMAVSNELGNEKVDIVEWSEDPAKLVKNSLSPAKATEVQILPRREARVFVPDDQLSLAIGRGGQNVRLAAKLTGWKIDVRSQSRPAETQEAGVAEAQPVAEAEPQAEIKPEKKGE